MTNIVMCASIVPKGILQTSGVLQAGGQWKDEFAIHKGTNWVWRNGTNIYDKEKVNSKNLHYWQPHYDDLTVSQKSLAHEGEGVSMLIQ